MKPTDEVVKALAVVAELTGTDFSPAAVRLVADELARFPEAQVLAALRRCCRELKPRQLTLEAILSRIDDGRPGPEEAWAMIPKDEAGSVVWTSEMRLAFTAAAPLVLDGDLVAGRMAFRERYTLLVQQARDARLPVEWEFSPGTDKSGRELALLDAAEKGRLSVEAVQRLLPYHRDDEVLRARLLALDHRALPKLEDQTKPPAGWAKLGEKLCLPRKAA